MGFWGALFATWTSAFMAFRHCKIKVIILATFWSILRALIEKPLTWIRLWRVGPKIIESVNFYRTSTYLQDFHHILLIRSQADRYRLPRIVFVNKMDRPMANFGNCLRSLRQRFGGVFFPLQMPVYINKDRFTGIVDLPSLTLKVASHFNFFTLINYCNLVMASIYRTRWFAFLSCRFV